MTGSGPRLLAIVVPLLVLAMSVGLFPTTAHGAVFPTVATFTEADGGFALASNAPLTNAQGQHCYSCALGIARVRADGTLDPSFGLNGRVRHDTSGLEFEPRAITKTDDGGYLIASYGSQSISNLQLLRVDAQGKIDKQFGVNGVLAPVLPQGSGTHVQKVIFDDQDRLLVLQSADGIAVTRLTPNGSPDLSYGLQGTAAFTDYQLGDNNYTWEMHALGFDNGRLLVAGTAYTGGVTDRVLVARLTSGGQLDSSFNANADPDPEVPPRQVPGWNETEDPEPNYLTSYAVAKDVNGNVIASGYDGRCGNCSTRGWAVRLTSDGEPDPFYGVSGWARTQNVITGIGATNQGSWLVGHPYQLTFGDYSYPGSWEISRLTLDGSVDSGFGTSGHVRTEFSRGSDCPPSQPIYSPPSAESAFAVSGDRVVVVGRSHRCGTSNGRAAMVRYLPNGAIDTSFGTNGFVVIDFESVSLTGGSDPSTTRPRSYVALGDSVAAGEGIGYGWQWIAGPDGTLGQYRWFRSGAEVWDSSFVSERCHQSLSAAPRLIASELGLNLEHLACTGSTAYNGVLKDRVKDSERYESAQLGSDAIAEVGAPNPRYDAARPDIVSLSLGANDVDFADIVTSCYGLERNCATDANREAFERKLGTQSATLQLVLEEIGRRGRSAGKVPLVAITEYFDPFPASYPTREEKCVDIDPPIPGAFLSAGEMSFLRAGLMQLQQSIEVVGRRFPNVVLVRTPPGFREHRWCSTDPWTFGPSIVGSVSGQTVNRGNQAPFHPTTDGQRAIAEQIAAALRGQRSVQPGTNVVVPLGEGLTLAFDKVTAGGQVSLVPKGQVASYPVAPNFRLTSGFDLAVSVGFTGSATLRVAASVDDRLYHYTDRMWTEVPSTYANGKLTARVTSFSPYAIGRPTAVVKAGFTFAGEGLAPAQVTFESASATSGTDLSYQWEFGDGGTASTAQPSHLYKTSGDYAVTLTVTSSGGAVDQASKIVSVTNASPTAAIAGPTSVQEGTVSEFDAAGSRDTNGSVDELIWEFGDGSPPASGARVRHVFPVAGRYEVRLLVTDDEGATNEAASAVTVMSKPAASSGANTAPAPSPFSPMLPVAPFTGAADPPSSKPTGPHTVTIVARPSRVKQRQISRLVVSYGVSRPGKLRLAILRQKVGVVKKGCRSTSVWLQGRCYVPVSNGAASVQAQQSSGKVRLVDTRLRKVRFGRGAYVIRAYVTASGTARSKPAYAYFRIQ